MYAEGKRLTDFAQELMDLVGAKSYIATTEQIKVTIPGTDIILVLAGPRMGVTWQGFNEIILGNLRNLKSAVALGLEEAVNIRVAQVLHGRR